MVWRSSARSKSKWKSLSEFAVPLRWPLFVPNDDTQSAGHAIILFLLCIALPQTRLGDTNAHQRRVGDLRAGRQSFRWPAAARFVRSECEETFKAFLIPHNYSFAAYG